MRTRNGVRLWRGLSVEGERVKEAFGCSIFVIPIVRGGRDWPGRGERRLGDQNAAVHRHSLDRLTMINDSLKNIKKRMG